ITTLVKLSNAHSPAVLVGARSRLKSTKTTLQRRCNDLPTAMRGPGGTDLRRSAGLILLSILLLASLPACADLCKYRDADGNIRYSADGAQPGWTVLWCSRPSPSLAAPKREKSDASSDSAKWVHPDA